MGHGIESVDFDDLDYGQKKQSINATVNLYLPQAVDNLLRYSPCPDEDGRWVAGLLRSMADRIGGG